MQIHPSDNVEVRTDGHKYALTYLKNGDNVIKYGYPIGHMTADAEIGELVGPHNLTSNLSGLGDWHYTPHQAVDIPHNGAS